MNKPFSTEQFLTVFENSILPFWLMQTLLYVLAFVVIILAINKKNYSDWVIGLIMSLFWLWMGFVCHLINFTSFSTATQIFSVLYRIQGLLFLFSGVFKNQLSFKYRSDIYGFLGGIFMLYALVFYPVLGYFFRHLYLVSPVFGVPGPITIFTFGILLWSDKKVPTYLLVIPLLWTVAGFREAVDIHVKEDFILAISGISGVILLLIKDRKSI